MKLVATYAADKVRHIYDATDGADGYALGQLNPGRAGDAEGMLAQGRPGAFLGAQHRGQAAGHGCRCGGH